MLVHTRSEPVEVKDRQQLCTHRISTDPSKVTVSDSDMPCGAVMLVSVQGARPAARFNPENRTCAPQPKQLAGHKHPRLVQ